jgi:hypothetical protein
VPVIVTENPLAVIEVQINEDVPVPLAVSETGVTVNELQIKPAGTVSERPTVPTKLKVLVRVTVEVLDEPATPDGDVALIVKSPTWDTKIAECVRPPPVPVIVTRYVPGVEDPGLHVPVTALGPVTVRLGGQFALRPVEGETVTTSVTVPVKPLTGVTVIVELPVAPVLKSAGEVAEIVKSAVNVNTGVVE